MKGIFNQWVLLAIIIVILGFFAYTQGFFTGEVFGIAGENQDTWKFSGTTISGYIKMGCDTLYANEAGKGVDGRTGVLLGSLGREKEYQALGEYVESSNPDLTCMLVTTYDNAPTVETPVTCNIYTSGTYDWQVYDETTKGYKTETIKRVYINLGPMSVKKPGGITETNLCSQVTISNDIVDTTETIEFGEKEVSEEEFIPHGEVTTFTATDTAGKEVQPGIVDRFFAFLRSIGVKLGIWQ